jgi:hypothetical protein
MAGARAELSRGGALKAGGYPQVVIEVLRVDEQALGIASSPEAGRQAPLARGTTLAVVGRARLVEAPGAPPTRDSGDFRRAERFEASSNRHAEASVRQQAVRSAARRLGRALMRRILGQPEPETEPL